jgi:hypothetical protein
MHALSRLVADMKRIRRHLSVNRRSVDEGEGQQQWSLVGNSTGEETYGDYEEEVEEKLAPSVDRETNGIDEKPLPSSPTPKSQQSKYLCMR